MTTTNQTESSKLKKIVIGSAGGLVTIVGIVLIPYPGPGWLVVFAGLGILAREFQWAQDILDTLKEKYESWQSWLAQQSEVVKVFVWLLTFAVVIITVYLLNGYGLLNQWLHLGQEWLKSPIFGN